MKTLKKIFKHISEADKHVWGYSTIYYTPLLDCVYLIFRY